MHRIGHGAQRGGSISEELRTILKACKPELVPSLSPNDADFAYRLQIQDWRTWVKEGLVDEVVVQL